MTSPDPQLYSKLQQWQRRFQTELEERVLPFWLNHSLDREWGGYFNNLDRDGQIYDTQKHVWLQARQVWMLSKLYNQREARPEWLAAATLGIDFLRQYAHRPDHRVYFSLTREGKPLQLQRKIFAECFYVMALAEYARATQDQTLRSEAVAVFESVLRWSQDLSQVGRPHFAGSVPTSELAIPMILLGVIGELNGSERAEWLATADQCVAQLQLHIKPELKLVLETVGTEGQLLDTPQGRLINPGHAIEAGWFLLDYATRQRIPDLVQIGLQMIDWSLEVGWDREFGGLYYFLDRSGYSPVQLEWSLKLWWPHCEALVATLYAFDLTQDPRWFERFEQMATYTFARFPDPEWGEWFGYLDRQGRVSQRFKGGPYKGCFHVPRALFLGDQVLTRILNSMSVRN